MPSSDMGQAPAQSPGYYAARMAVIILSVLIVVALAALVIGVIRKGAAPAPAAAPDSAQAYVLPPGAQVVQMQSQPDRLILHVRMQGGEEIVILNTDDGSLVRRLRTAP